MIAIAPADLCSGLTPGSTVKLADLLVRLLIKIDSRWGLDAHQVGNLCKQREDLRKGGVNEWVIVEAAR